MLTRTRISIATLAVTGLALTAASPASAIYRDYETTADAPTTGRTVKQPVGTKSCTVEVTAPDGKKTTFTYPPGSKITVNGKEYECQDGTWVPTAPMDSIGPGGDYVYEPDGIYVETDGTLVGENLHEVHSYSNDGGYYAEP